jgi:hypothetical protein
MIGRTVNKDLRFVFQPTETTTVKYTIAVALKTGTYRMVGFCITPSETVFAMSRVWGKVLSFKLFPILSGVCHILNCSFFPAVGNGALEKSDAETTSGGQCRQKLQNIYSLSCTLSPNLILNRNPASSPPDQLENRL